MFTLANPKNATALKAIIVGLTFLLLSGELLPQVEGGCSRFGHSCFGAHGKRADGAFDLGSPAEQAANNYGQEYYPTYPQGLGRLNPFMIEWIMSVARRIEESRQAPEALSGAAAGASDRRK